MDVFLPVGFEPGLSRARISRPIGVSTLCVKAGGVMYPVLRRWGSGFVVSAGDAPAPTGLVDLYDGAEHLYQCQVTRGATEQGNTGQGDRIFTVKRVVEVDYSAVYQIEQNFGAAAFR